MRTRSSSNLPVESPRNQSTSNPKRRNRRRSKHHFILEESPVDTMADQRTMAELLRAPTEGYAKAIVDAQANAAKKDEVQIHKIWQMFKQLHINITLADALILIPKYQKMLIALLSNKEKLLELANTPLIEKCSAVILKKLPIKLGDPGKFLIPCGFSELKCKTLADLGASINLMPLSVWKKLGLPELISTRMTLELANRAICTPTGIARDVFVSDIDSFLEKSDTSLSFPEYETFINHTEETSSGSTTTHADYSLSKYDSFLFEIELDQGKLSSVVMKDNLAESRVHVPSVLTTHPTLMLDSDFIPSDNSLPEYEIFYFDIEEKNSGSTTIHVDISLPGLESFNFGFKSDPGELTSIVDSEICENILSATNVNFPLAKDHSPLFAYVVWIFLSFLTYHVVPPNLLSFRNEDTIFDPGIANYHFPSLLPDVSHRCETFMKFNVYPKLLNEILMEILSSSCSIREQ
nr:reverse transcriptase domain-containing protein [Tanacetum cinerariifolium]